MTDIRLLAVHGIGRHPAGGKWEDDWRAAISRGVDAATPDARVVTEFVHYDDLFEARRLTFWDTVQAVAKLVASAVAAPTRGVGSVPQSLRWTAGMVVKWVEDEDFRRDTRERLVAAIEAVRPSAVLGHSLGSLVCYDVFTHPSTRARVRGTVLVTLGSQIANPFVSGQFLAGRIAVPEAATHWYHLFNRDDDVFTAPIHLTDVRFTQVDTWFDEAGFGDHSAEQYLVHQQASAVVWWALTRPGASRTVSRRRSVRPPARAAHLARPRHRAVLVGINEYRNPRDRLAGCVNDAFLMSSVLQEAGVAAADIRVVLDQRATAKAVKERIEWLLDDVQPGDQRVFYYSGHGAQIPTYGVAGRPDATKECLVPYDFDWSDETAVTDDWFHEIYAHLPYDVDFLAIFDCCHSGGMARSGLPRAKGIDPPDDIRHRALQWSPEHDMWIDRKFTAENREFQKRSPIRDDDGQRHRMTDRLGYAMPLRGLPKRVFDRRRRALGHAGPYMPLLFYACREDERAYEYLHGSVSYGAFTYALAKTIRRETRERRQQPTCRQLVRLVDHDMRDLGYEQRPALEGPRVKQSRAFPYTTESTRTAKRRS